MLKFSANLGFLWTELPLTDRVRAAARAGFDAVEVHYPYETPAGELRRVLDETALPLLSLNTRIWPDAFGLAAVPGEESRARDAIDEAIAYASEAGAAAIHVMAGAAEGDEAEAVFRANLAHAVSHTDRTILIEPINPGDAPGYFLADFDLAARIAHDTGAKVMLDCYHAAALGRDPLDIWRRYGALLGHVQFADYPGRGAPGTGASPLEAVLPALRDAGYAGAFGAEYRPAGPTEASLDWLNRFRERA